MELTLIDTLIIFENVVASLMLFLNILLWNKKRDLSSITFFSISLIIYIQIVLNALAYYHILNVEVLIKINNYPVINYLLDVILLFLVIFYLLHLIKLSASDEIRKDSNDK